MWIYYIFIVKEKIWFVTKLNATLFDNGVNKGGMHWFPTNTLSNDRVNRGGMHIFTTD